MFCEVCNNPIAKEEIFLSAKGDRTPNTCIKCREEEKEENNKFCDRCGEKSTEYYFGHFLCDDCLEEER